MRSRHVQPGGEVVETAALPDGRVIRCIGFADDLREPARELRGWVILAGFLATLFALVGCGGAAFSPGGEEVGDSAPARGDSGGAEPAPEGGDTDSRPEPLDAQAECDRCSCPPEGAVCGHPVDASADVGPVDPPTWPACSGTAPAGAFWVSVAHADGAAAYCSHQPAPGAYDCPSILAAWSCNGWLGTANVQTLGCHADSADPSVLQVDCEEP